MEIKSITPDIASTVELRRKPLTVEDFSFESAKEPDGNSNWLLDLGNLLFEYLKSLFQFLLSFCAHDAASKDLLDQLFACLCEKGLGEEGTVQQFWKISEGLDRSLKEQLMEKVKSKCLENEKPADLDARMQEIFSTGELYRCGYVADALLELSNSI